MPLPAHVAAVEADHVCLGGAVRELLAALRDSPYAGRLFRDSQLRTCIRLSEPGNPLASAELAELLGFLAGRGAAFLEVVDRSYGPAELMRALQADGSLPVAFQSLLVRSPEDWSLHRHPL